MNSASLEDRIAQVAVDLLTDGLGVCNEFIAMSTVRELVNCAHERRERGEFRGARIGFGQRLQRREEVRGDSTCWFGEPLFDAEQSLLSDIEALRSYLNQKTFLGLFDVEVHYAWYPPGTGYARHVDQPMGRDSRKISLIVYLNESWAPGAGGELRVFDVGHHCKDIEPVAGRLVCFLTAGREHAVLDTRTPRLSISGWFRGRESMT